jgi:uncharacterized protein
MLKPNLRIPAIAFISIVATAYLLIGRIGYDAITMPIGSAWTGEPSGDYRDVTFTPRGKTYNVFAFYLPGNPGAPALISVHGYRGSRHDEFHLERAMALRDLGYTVLSLDLSDGGGDTIDSGRIAMGDAERWDVLGGFDYLLTQGFTADQIGLVGESMGGATVLLAAAAEPRIRAVWADSAYTRADTVIAERMQQSGLPSIIVPGGMVWGWLLTGDKLWEAAPIDAANSFATNRQAVYLVHCELDTTVQFHHGRDMFANYQSAGVDVTFWDVPNLGHVAAFFDHRAEYMSRLDRFFKSHLTAEF